MLAKFLERLRRGSQQPVPELLGRPQIRREKAYAADSGYVYQYTYEGYRAATRSDSCRQGVRVRVHVRQGLLGFASPCSLPTRASQPGSGARAAT